MKVLHPGSYSCILDLGRFHLRKYGVPSSGPMDVRSAMRSQTLVDNPIEYPIIEAFLSGLHLEFDEASLCSVSGGAADIFINNKLQTTTEQIHLNGGDTLKIGAMRSGARSYLAIKGIIQAPNILDSACPINGYNDSRLVKNEVLQILPRSEKTISSGSLIKPVFIAPEAPIIVRPGPEWILLEKDAQASLLSKTYIISSTADRMGYRLEGENIAVSKKIEILSAPVLPGTVQLLPSGLPLILMKDCQTTGGYPRVLQVDDNSIIQLAQRKSGDKVRFQIAD